MVGQLLCVSFCPSLATGYSLTHKSAACCVCMGECVAVVRLEARLTATADTAQGLGVRPDVPGFGAQECACCLHHTP